jgi:hypothetical protein
MLGMEAVWPVRRSSTTNPTLKELCFKTTPRRGDSELVEKRLFITQGWSFPAVLIFQNIKLKLTNIMFYSFEKTRLYFNYQ